MRSPSWPSGLAVAVITSFMFPAPTTADRTTARVEVTDSATAKSILYRIGIADEDAA